MYIQSLIECTYIFAVYTIKLMLYVYCSLYVNPLFPLSSPLPFPPRCPQLRTDVNTLLYIQAFQPLGPDAAPVLTQLHTPKVFNTIPEVPIGSK